MTACWVHHLKLEAILHKGAPLRSQPNLAFSVPRLCTRQNNQTGKNPLKYSAVTGN